MTVTLKFDKDESYFPLAGKPDDPFDDNFKLVVIADVTEPQTFNFGLVVRWKGVAYLIFEKPIDFEDAGTYKLEITWSATPPTIGDFIQAFGEDIPKKTTEYSYSWIVGEVLDSEMSVHDEWPTSLLVEITPFPWEKVILGTGVAIGAIGLGYVALKRR